MLYQGFTPRGIVEILLNFGWSQKDIGDAIGRSDVAICNIATGRSKPKKETVDKLLELAEREAKKLDALRGRLVNYLDAAK